MTYLLKNKYGRHIILKVDDYNTTKQIAVNNQKSFWFNLEDLNNLEWVEDDEPENFFTYLENNPSLEIILKDFKLETLPKDYPELFI